MELAPMPREIPKLAVLLAPFIEKIPDAGRPAFLAMLERGAAQRYREWAAQAKEAAPGLLACAAREEEIARRVDALFPARLAGDPVVDSAFAGAREVYYAVFAGLPLTGQWRIQASAEREGAGAWRLLASQQSDHARRDALLACAALEEASAVHLDGLVAAGA
jgi:hypothetical protein